jgi:polyisoprenoid-binding protein YceI
LTARPRSLPVRLAVLATALAGFGAAASAAAEPQRFRLDPQHSFVVFEVLHFGASTLSGRFGPVNGVVELDPPAQRGDVNLAITISSLDTGWSFLNRRLLEPDLLDAKEHPQAYFVAQQFRYDGTRVAEVRGEFTLRGISRPLSLVAERFGCRSDIDPGGAEVCGGDFVGEFKRSDYGAGYGVPFVGDRVRLRVQVEGRREGTL